MRAPEFSVVIPVYNRSDVVLETLKSVAVQSYHHFEVIMVNDGSTDNTLEVLNQFAATDNRFRVVNQSNRGRCVARNRGMAESTGRWICLLDSDDLWRHDHLEVLNNVICTRPAARAIATRLKRGIGATDAINRSGDRWLTIEHLVADNPVSILQLCFHRSLTESGLRFEEKEDLQVAEDWLFVRELVQRTPIWKVGIVTAEIREHPDRSMYRSGAVVIASCNVRSTEIFLSRNAVLPAQARRMRLHTLRLSADVLIADGKPELARPLLGALLGRPSAWIQIRTWWTCWKYLKQWLLQGFVHLR